ncbi:MAG: 30S ribosome-binding factor RbfA [Clostridiales bacterium]|nr:30S ribosome-binding factor RbfA [Clostridiales bacterium]
MASIRAGRMSEDIRRIVSAKMRELKDPRLHGGLALTVVRCDVASDGSHAKIYISSFDGFEKAKEAVMGLESAKGIIKRDISNILKLKKCPELKFIPDNSVEHSVEINKILKEVSDKNNVDKDNIDEE